MGSAGSTTFARALKCGRGILSLRLKTLVQANVLEKRDYLDRECQRPEYHLTAKGRDLYPAMLALSQWSDRWDLPKAGPAARVVDKESKRAVSVVMTSRTDVAKSNDEMIFLSVRDQVPNVCRDSREALTPPVCDRPADTVLRDLEDEIWPVAGQRPGEQALALDAPILVMAPCERQF